MKAGKETIKYINKQNILTSFRNRDEVCKAEIVDSTGLSPATVSFLIQELVDEGYLLEERFGESSGGRKPMLYRLNGDLAFVLAVRITPKGLALGILNLCGEIVYHKVLRTQIHDGSSLERALEISIGQMNREAPKLAAGISSAAYSIPGVLEYSTGKVLYSAALFVEDFDLQRLTDRLMGRRMELYLFKDTDALILNEYYEAGMDDRNMVYLYCDNGVGMSVINGGKLLRIDGCGLEIGHTSIDIHGETCKCSSVGCVGTLLGELPALNRYDARRRQEGKEEYGDITDLTYQELVELAADGQDAAAKEVMEEQIELLTVVLVNLVNLFNPGVVVIGSPLTNCPQVVESLEQAVKKRALKPFTRELVLRASRQDSNAALYGMVNYVLDREVFKTLSL